MRRVAHDDLRRAAVRRPAGYIDDVRSLASEITDTHVILSDQAYDELFAKYSPLYVDPGHGPGTELKAMLASVGIVPDEKCKCVQRAKLMNIWGADECERRLDEIVGWLKEEASARRLPFVEIAAVALVRKAIRRSRK